MKRKASPTLAFPPRDLPPRPSLDLLVDWLAYDPIEGLFYRCNRYATLSTENLKDVRGLARSKWHTVVPRSAWITDVSALPIDRTIGRDGTPVVTVGSRRWLARDVAWLFTRGEWPPAKHRVIHLDGNPRAHRPENLALVPPSPPRKHRAVVRVGTHLIQLGYYATQEHAVEAQDMYRLGLYHLWREAYDATAYRAEPIHVPPLDPPPYPPMPHSLMTWTDTRDLRAGR